jgi:NAD(P)-dependent dehydrogenase (short-subunit alcohol dehydrogenase family)
METSGTGIKVVLVEPGLVKTDWGHIAADHLESVSQGGPYARLAAHVAAGMHKLYKSRWCSPPAEVAKVVFLAANAAQPQSRYLAGRGAYLILFLHAILPTSLFDALARRVMKKL